MLPLSICHFSQASISASIASLVSSGKSNTERQFRQSSICSPCVEPSQPSLAASCIRSIRSLSHNQSSDELPKRIESNSREFSKSESDLIILVDPFQADPLAGVGDVAKSPFKLFVNLSPVLRKRLVTPPASTGIKAHLASDFTVSLVKWTPLPTIPIYSESVMSRDNIKTVEIHWITLYEK